MSHAQIYETIKHVNYFDWDRCKQKGFAQFLLILILLAGIGLAVYLTQFTQVFKPKANTSPSAKIIVSGKRLIDSSNNQDFQVRSVYYLNILSKAGNPVSMFNSQYFNESYIDGHFTWMKILGFNTVRLTYHNHEDGEASLLSSAGLCREGNNQGFNKCHDIRSVDNLIKTLNIAKRHNLKVILTLYGGVTARYATNISNPGYGANSQYLEVQTVKDYSRYLTDFFTYIKNSGTDTSTILAIQPQAEPWLIRNEFPLQSGNILHPGTQFTVSRDYPITNNVLTKTGGKNSETMNQILTDSLTYSFNAWFAAIKSVDPTFLTAYDQFPSYAVSNEDTRHVYDLELINPNLHADIIGMQLYRYVPISEPGTSSQILTRMLDFYPGFKTNLVNFQKPFIMWEYGYDNINMGTPDANKLGAGVTTKAEFLKDWMKASCELKPAGWNLFFWRHANSDPANAGFEPIDANDFALARSVAPVNFPNPCAVPISNPSSSPAKYVGDLNDDGSVDALDFGVFVRDFRDQNLRSDFNNSGEVDIFDFNILIQNIGK